MLLFLESFDQYGAISAANLADAMKDKWALADLTAFDDGSIIDGRHGGKGITMGSANQFIRTRRLRDPTVEQDGIVGFAIKTRGGNSLGSNTSFLDIHAGGQDQLSFRINSSGTVTAYRDNLISLETSPGVIFDPNAGWYYVEIRFKIHNSTGSWTFKIDGQTVWTSSTHDTQANSSVYWDSIQFNIGDIAEDTILDDIYICDGSGTQNNDFLGDTVVELIQPNSNGDASDWAGSVGGDHYTLVDDAQGVTSAGLSESDYIESSTPTHKDLFGYSNLSALASATTIHGVQVNTWRRITAEQPLDLDIIAKSVATESNVTDTVRHDDSAPYFMSFAVFEQDPNTATAWTSGGVDAAQFGVEVV